MSDNIKAFLDFASEKFGPLLIMSVLVLGILFIVNGLVDKFADAYIAKDIAEDNRIIGGVFKKLDLIIEKLNKLERPTK